MGPLPLTLLVVFLGMLLTPDCASGHPRTYTVEAIHVAPSGDEISGVRINKFREVVWFQFTQSSGVGTWEIHSSVRGQITHNSIGDCCPAINDLGQLAWQATLDGNDTDWEIVLDGARITSNTTPDTDAKINNPGEVIWDAADGLRSNLRGLVVAGGTSSPEINNLGEIVYRSGSGESSTVHSTVQGVLGTGDHPTINDSGEVIWGSGGNLVSSIRGILGPGNFPAINSSGDVVFLGLVDGHGTVIVLHDGVEIPIDDDILLSPFPFPDINDRGFVAFAATSGLGQAVFIATPTPGCGDDAVDTDEECDLGIANGSEGTCCNEACEAAPPSSICRPLSGICDVAENCTGSSGVCPADAVASDTTGCRVASGACDLPEFCTGTSVICPVDDLTP